MKCGELFVERDGEGDVEEDELVVLRSLDYSQHINIMI